MNSLNDMDTIDLSKLKTTSGDFKYDISSEQFGMSVAIQYDILKNDIKKNGQLEPIYIWRNRIGDGRNRCKALDELGIDKVKVIRLPHKMDEEERMEFAGSTEMARRHESPTQLVCVAAKEYGRRKSIPGLKVSISDIREEYPVTATLLSNANWLYKNEPSVFKILFDGGKIQLDPYREATTDSITTVWSHFKAIHKRREEDAKRAEERECSEMDGAIEDEDGVLEYPETKSSPEYVAMITLAKMLTPVVVSFKKLTDFDMTKFCEVWIEYMRDEGYETEKRAVEEPTDTDSNETKPKPTPEEAAANSEFYNDAMKG